MAALSLTMFAKDTSSIDAPSVGAFRAVLEQIAKDYGSSLTYFSVEHGKVLFSFDNEQLLYDIMEAIRDTLGLRPVIMNRTGSANIKKSQGGVRRDI
jgi:hypothetical protein